MSAIHEQAMNYVYQQVLQRLVGHFSRTERTSLQLLIQRIVVAAGGMERIGEYKVLLAHGAGAGSSYVLTLLRAAQLTLAGRAPGTFQLRVATLRHAGMTQTALDTLHRGYSALFLHDDPRVELLMVENREVLPFNHLRPASATARDNSRRNVLMVGHQTSGDLRQTLCNDAYLALGDFYQRVTTCNGGVHALVSGDSARKQREYLAWLKRAALLAGATLPEQEPLVLSGLFARMDEWSNVYYGDLYGEHYEKVDTCDTDAPRHLAYVSVADLMEEVDYPGGSLLRQFMAYQPDEFGFHFSHASCANPLLMAHLRGLQAECLRELDYEEGAQGFMQQAALFMRHKQIPEHLIAQAATPDGRALSAGYAQAMFGLDDNQLNCLMFSPFIGHGERLESFLRECHPGMLVALAELHKALQGKPVAEMLVQWAIDISGLPLHLLQHLYRKRPAAAVPCMAPPQHATAAMATRQLAGR
ncbi:hypothetical protein RGV33_15700 [Pseudomonas sp. Bout1]|uniref:hypothetical protein n=1 Tax=Pseudomonas sp. Bout1 TaxID=3048600 RepID=UPI002AB3D8AA|nr:hypothetical protein [Pseudomonas sp. Bout1]MDY7533110.1 hypothetical protein [Pseudomonas sp. Bout1]MEB0184409.1 hypothetical protein [Pseudomonas sp. Bout1]